VLAAERSAAASDSDFASADEQLSSGTSGYASSNGGALNQAPAAASLPPPALSSRPTSAQAAVATQWSPNKNAAAIAQAPAYMREVVMDGPLVREASGLSNPYQAAPAPPAGGGGGRKTPGLSSFLGPSSHDIYAPLPRVMAQQPAYSTYQAQQLQSAPQQPVVTAVDLARRQSMARRTSGPGHRGSEHDASAPQRRGGPGPQQQLYSSSSAYGAGSGYYTTAGSNSGLYSAASSTWGSQPSSRAASGAFGPLAARQPSMQRQQYGLYTR
jgi:hypothetical protein